MHFIGSRNNRLRCHQFERRIEGLRGSKRVFHRSLARCPLCEKRFDESIFERVVRYDDKRPSVPQHFYRLMKAHAECIHFLVYFNPKRLKDACERLCLKPGPRDFPHNSGEVGCPNKEAAHPSSIDRPGDPTRLSLFAVVVEDLSKRICPVRIDDLCRAQRAAGVHSHVQRPIFLKAEAAFRRIDLMGGNAKIEHDSVDLPHTQMVEQAAEVAEIPVSRREAIAEFLQALCRVVEGFLVSIDADQPPCGAQILQNGLAMPASPKRGVYIDPLWIVQKVVESFA